REPPRRQDGRAEPYESHHRLVLQAQAPYAVAEILAHCDEQVTVPCGFDPGLRHRALLHAIHPLLRMQHRDGTIAPEHTDFRFDCLVVRSLYGARAHELEGVITQFEALSR